MGYTLKSTRYGRQNPISARWNSEEQLVLWRAAWADTTNQFLEQAGTQERIDHRSHAARGLDEQPTIHEGVTARRLEQKGIISERCELNRQIKADNALLKELKALVRKLMNAIKSSVSAITEAMEAARQKMIIFRYQLLHIGTGRRRISNTLHAFQPDIKRYEDTVMQLKAKIKERRVLLNEKKNTPAIQVLQHRKLAQKIAVLTEDIEELKNEKTLLLNQLNCVDDHGMDQIKQRIGSMESSLQTLNQQEEKYTVELDAALAQYTELQQQAADMDAMEVDTTRQAIRTDKERETARRLQTAYGKKFDYGTLAQSRKDVAEMLGEPVEQVSVHQTLQQLQGQHDRESHKKKHSQER